MVREEIPKENFYFDDEEILRKEDELFRKINIKSNLLIYFYVNINNTDYTFPIQLSNIDINSSLLELKKTLIREINQSKLEINIGSRKYFLSLREGEDGLYKEKYELRNCKKKNHFPKYELPPLLDDSIVETIIGQRICILYKNNDAMLLNPILDENENKNDYEKEIKKEKYHGKCIIM